MISTSELERLAGLVGGVAMHLDGFGKILQVCAEDDETPFRRGEMLASYAADPERVRRTLTDAVRTGDRRPIRLQPDPGGPIYRGRLMQVTDAIGAEVIAVVRPLHRAGADPFVSLTDRIEALSDALRQNRVLTAELSATADLLAESEARFRSLVEPSPDPLISLDADLTILAANGACEQLGRGLPEIGSKLSAAYLGDRLMQLVTTAAEDVRVAGEPVMLDGVEVVGDRGEPHWFDLWLTPGHDVGRVHLVARDVTDRVVAEQRLAAMALTDPLTGLGNRAVLYDRLTHTIHQRERRMTGIVIALLDVDHFKAINDAWGHATGDEALKAVSKRLERAVRSGDTVCRIGGDEFVLVLEDVESREEAVTIVERLHERISSGLRTAQTSEGFTVSIGFTWTRSPSARAEALLDAADVALYQAKRRGRNQTVLFDQGWAPGPFGSAGELTRELEEAARSRAFELYYQPIVAPSGTPVGCEALLRWNHPRLGLLEPEVFIGPLIDAGLIVHVGRWVIEAATAMLGRWREEGAVPPDLTVHVNVSPTQFHDVSLVDTLANACEYASVPCSSVCIEVTEQALFLPPGPGSALERLRELGFVIALDDFGTGMSSLAQLRHNAVGMVKVDRSFVAGIGSPDRSERILAGVIELARSLELPVVAEGVEKREQLDWLIERQCDSIQGFVASPPVPPEDLPGVLARLVRHSQRTILDDLADDSSS